MTNAGGCFTLIDRENRNDISAAGRKNKRKDDKAMAVKTLYTVVVADDEDVLREAVCSMVPWQELGFSLVGSASNGLDALQLEIGRASCRERV